LEDSKTVIKDRQSYQRQKTAIKEPLKTVIKDKTALKTKTAKEDKAICY
jgi:hypothetical protein